MVAPEQAPRDPHAGHGHTQPSVKRWAGLEGWWIVAGIIALLILFAIRLVWFA